MINQQGRPFTHGYEIHLEKATIQFEFQAFADQAEARVLFDLEAMLEKMLMAPLQSDYAQRLVQARSNVRDECTR